MISYKGNEAIKPITDELRGLFRSSSVFYSIHKHISFICGGQSTTDPKNPPNRSLYLEHLKNTSNAEILPVLAEKAIDEFLAAGDSERLELSLFEELIAEVVDSVLIFPESPGSFAELGFFSAKEKICKKTLVANPINLQEQSFINLGPIQIISSKSNYSPNPIIIGGDLENDFERITKTITQHTKKRKYRDRFEIDEFHDASPKDQLAAIYATLQAFGYITEKNLKEIIHLTFGRYDIKRIRHIIAILVAMEYVKRNINGDLIISAHAPEILTFDGTRFDSIKIKIRSFYQTHDPDCLAEIKSNA